MNSEAKEGLRLHVFLSHAGAASRRASEELIRQGRVTVNGVTVTEMGTRVFSSDKVCLDGSPIHPEKSLHYIALNKPPGYLCSASDPQDRPLALELLPKRIGERLYSVGRLDFLSSGLIFFTNDGDFAQSIGHPSSKIEKEYLVEATGAIKDEVVQAFLNGISIEGEYYKALRIERLGTRKIKIVLIQGKNREIRRVFSHFHLHPRLLRRIRIGPVELGDLKEGSSRPLSHKELKALRIIAKGGGVNHGNRD